MQDIDSLLLAFIKKISSELFWKNEQKFLCRTNTKHRK